MLTCYTERIVNITSISTRSSLLRRLLAMKLSGEFIVIFPLYTIMMTERSGLPASHVGIIVSLGLVLSVLLEIPTGVIADAWPRKYSLVFAALCKIAALSSWLLWPAFYGYALGAALFAAGAAFESGALQAYLYGVTSTTNKQAFGAFWAKLQAMIMIAYTAAFVTASLIGPRYAWLLLASLAAAVISFGMSLSLPVDSIVKHSKKAAVQRPHIFRGALQHILRTGDLMRLLLGALVVIALSETVIEFSSLYYRFLGVELTIIPLVLAGGNIVGAVSFWMLPRYDAWLSKYKVALAILIGALFIVSFSAPITVGVLVLVLMTRFLRVLQVQFDATIQHLAEDRTRATVSSIGSFGAKLGAAGLVAGIGAAAGNGAILHPFRAVLVGGIAVFVAIQLLLWHRQKS